MSDRPFKEVFQGIILDKDADPYFDEVNVTGVTSVKNPEKLIIDIESTHLISRQNIKKAEEAVRLFVFGNYGKTKVVIKCNER